MNLKIAKKRKKRFFNPDFNISKREQFDKKKIGKRSRTN